MIPGGRRRFLKKLNIPMHPKLVEFTRSPRGRTAVYLALTVMLYFLAIALVSFKEQFDFVVSDGRWYYVYLPSLLVDGDLDFSNQIIEHWGPDFRPGLLEGVAPGELVHNQYTIGFALSLLPSFTVSHLLSFLLYDVLGLTGFEPDGYSILYQLLNLAAVMLLGTLTLLMIDKILVDYFSIEPRFVFLGVMGYWLGSNYSYYYFREPFMVHVVSGFWVVLSIHGAFRIRKLLESGGSRGRTPGRTMAWRTFLIVFSSSMAILSRPTNGAILIPFLLPLVLNRQVLRSLPVAMLGVFPIVLQMLLWKVMYGSYLHYGYGSEGFSWSGPRLLSTLFSSRHGLFFWSPILLFSLLGTLHAWRTGSGRKERFFILQLGLAFLGLWYLNSCWHSWWFGDAFGGRAFIELSLAFVAGLTWFLQAASRFRPLWRRISHGLIGSCIGYNYGLMALYIFHKIPRGDYLF